MGYLLPFVDPGKALRHLGVDINSCGWRSGSGAGKLLLQAARNCPRLELKLSQKIHFLV
jgi:hypothetical protein